MKKKISAEFPFKSNFLEVKGSKMYYVDVGKGDPVLFLHGNPTSSYLWRNIIPYLQNDARCIAPDLIGMGKSDKPDIDYSFDDHYEYLLEFIEKLGLKNVTLVVHDWGSGLGFHYANTHRKNIKGIAFMEAMVKPFSWDTMPADFKFMFKMMRSPFIGWLMISVANMFVKKMIPDTVVRKLSKKERDYYLAPYPSILSRRPVRVWPTEVPIDGTPSHTHLIIESYGKWLAKSSIPKLFFYATPGAIITKKIANWIKNNFKNTKSIDIGKGIHFIQEDNPHLIGAELKKWYGEI